MSLQKHPLLLQDLSKENMVLMDPKEGLINELHCVCFMLICKATFIENSSKQLKPILMGPE